MTVKSAHEKRGKLERGGRGRAWLQAADGPGLQRTGARARKDGHTDTQTYFCQLFPEPPMRKVGTHGEVQEKSEVGVGGWNGSVEWEKTPATYVRARHLYFQVTRWVPVRRGDGGLQPHPGRRRVVS